MRNYRGLVLSVVASVAASLVVGVPPASARTAAPPTPVVSSTDYPADNAPHGQVNLPGVFTFTTPSVRPIDVVAYAYTLDSGVQASAAPTVAPDLRTRRASVSLRPAHDGVNTLRVWARNRAGQFSATPATWTFTVRGPAGPAGTWDCDETAGDAVDGTGHGNTLAVHGATRAAGRGNQGGALSLNGSTQYAATAGPVTFPHPDTGAATPVRTDGSFTVTARVRRTGTGATTESGIVTASGSRTSAFTLGYSGADNRWRFAIAGADTNAPATFAVRSDAPAAADRWTHLAGVYDADSHQLRLYVNGVQQTGTATVTGGFNATGPLVVGRRLWAGAYTGYFGGLVDDVRLSNQVEDPARRGQLAAPLAATVTFPDGATAEKGSQLTVVFGSGGDENVTSFRYSYGSTLLDRTAVPTTPGGTATVSLPVGSHAGTELLYAASYDGTRLSPMGQWVITVTGQPSISGSVFNVLTGMYEPGAVVRLEPAGLQVVSGPQGEYSFTGFSPGTYTLSATVDGPCPLYGSIDLDITSPDQWSDVDVFPVSDTCEG